jgi:SAM-dependent methyltransferase
MRLWSALADRVRARLSLRYWERRARRYGPRSVLHLSHSAAEVEQVTEWQKNIVLPLLRAELRGDEKLALDYGCGPGRFTADLSELIDGRAIGVDPIRHLLDIAPPHAAVEYRLLRHGRIPLSDHAVDLVFVCLVLGTITNSNSIRQAIDELERVLRPGGLLFLVENTADRAPAKQIVFRTPAEYMRMFPSIRLRRLTDYEDLGERISVLAGRKIG